MPDITAEMIAEDQPLIEVDEPGDLVEEDETRESADAEAREDGIFAAAEGGGEGLA